MDAGKDNRFDNRILVLLGIVLVWFVVRMFGGAKLPDLSEEQLELQQEFRELATEATDGDEEWHLFERAFVRGE